MEELDKAIDAASEAEEILRDVGDRVGEGKAMHTIAVPWQGAQRPRYGHERRKTILKPGEYSLCMAFF